ncbi:MAG: O-antigen ligase family protein [Candidatus Binataceae bacterium]
MRWLDRIVKAGLIFLLVVTALFFGAVHRWAYAFAEAIIFLLVIAWAARLAMAARGRDPEYSVAEWRRLALPALMFTVLLVVQLAPLPPALIRALSPSTYNLYELSFPGWPRHRPNAELTRALAAMPAASPTPAFAVLPAVTPGAGTATRKSAAPNSEAATAEAVTAPLAAPSGWAAMRWRSLSIAPAATWAGLIEAVACAALFFLVLTYPFGATEDREAEARFCRTMVLGVLAIAFGVAFIGLAQRLAWNGRILGVFVPRDWGAPQLGNLRASGPFVDPDHFANYLAMVLPLALAGAMFRLPLVRKERRDDLRLACGAIVLLLAAAIVLSLSRGGWIAAAFGVWLVIALSLKYARERAPKFVRRLRIRVLPISLGVVAVVIAAVLFIIGPAARENVSTRIGGTISEGVDLSYRPAIWSDSLGMIRDFPLTGVGLGCWPEIFNHYLRPPWSPFFYREAENDYIQYFAETGLVGLALLIWFIYVAAGKLRRGAQALTPQRWPLYAGLMAGLAVMVLHESVEFSLHTPANAILFTVLLALALRIAAVRSGDRHPLAMPRGRAYAAATCAGVIALGFIVAAFAQPLAAYPYDIGEPTTVAAAELAVGRHPASAGAHMALLHMMGADAPLKLRLDELKAAVWLDPNNPYSRDIYAQDLVTAGRIRLGLEQVSLSVFHSPELTTHFYLAPRIIPWLLPEDQAAIESGLRHALNDHSGIALQTLAAFYGYLGRYQDAARMYAEMVGMTDDSGQKLDYLLEAGKQYAAAGDSDDAKAALHRAARLAPIDPRVYAELARVTYSLDGDTAAAKSVVENGVNQGAPPYQLYLALADVAANAKDYNIAEGALLKALAAEPASFEAAMKLGGIYMRDRKYDRAVLEFRQATQLNPHSPAAFFALGQADEGDFYYGEAGGAYAHAAGLSPENHYYHGQYLAFERRTAKSAAELRDNLPNAPRHPDAPRQNDLPASPAAAASPAANTMVDPPEH